MMSDVCVCECVLGVARDCGSYIHPTASWHEVERDSLISRSEYTLPHKQAQLNPSYKWDKCSGNTLALPRGRRIEWIIAVKVLQNENELPCGLSEFSTAKVMFWCERARERYSKVIVYVSVCEVRHIQTSAVALSASTALVKLLCMKAPFSGKWSCCLLCVRRIRRDGGFAAELNARIHKYLKHSITFAWCEHIFDLLASSVDFWAALSLIRTFTLATAVQQFHQIKKYSRNENNTSFPLFHFHSELPIFAGSALGWRANQKNCLCVCWKSFRSVCFAQHKTRFVHALRI